MTITTRAQSTLGSARARLARASSATGGVSPDRPPPSRTLQQRETLPRRHAFLAQPPDECSTPTERHIFLMGLVTLVLVLAVGIAGGSGVAWLPVNAWHHAGLSHAVVTR
jgi:hypothetical protein